MIHFRYIFHFLLFNALYLTTLTFPLHAEASISEGLFRLTVHFSTLFTLSMIIISILIRRIHRTFPLSALEKIYLYFGWPLISLFSNLSAMVLLDIFQGWLLFVLWGLIDIAILLAMLRGLNLSKRYGHAQSEDREN
jgi:hypothetical protein